MRNILIVAGGAVAVAAIAAGVYFGARAPSSPPPVAAVSAPNKAALESVQAGDHVLGDPKAPITVIEYASLTCSHCAHFHTQILPEIKKKWIDTGKVKLVYRDFPLDQVAAKAAQIAECAGNDKYFGVIDIIFRGQPQWATATDPLAELAKPLRIAGMGENEIKACLANDAMSNAVIKDYQGGEAMGVNSTPTLFINGQLYRGSRSVDELDGVFSKLAK
ncbi:MAG: DsbA family protein [Reyranella sp.]|uniref:DsbA family protein n=1 Tax=Reyranella sp. TaxID=1929291 RepID=UPI0012290165|nr:DsbA family protein [Reyranella sp.]TAJ94771.1 MAG: DsbA family protein [Reyranella sp.]TBR28086.1 MAG: DsbA family protein [Reyranella sp.]